MRVHAVVNLLLNIYLDPNNKHVCHFGGPPADTDGWLLESTRGIYLHEKTQEAFLAQQKSC
jgi:hypothetical protein